MPAVNLSMIDNDLSMLAVKNMTSMEIEQLCTQITFFLVFILVGLMFGGDSSVECLCIRQQNQQKRNL